MVSSPYEHPRLSLGSGLVFGVFFFVLVSSLEQEILPVISIVYSFDMYICLQCFNGTELVHRVTVRLFFLKDAL